MMRELPMLMAVCFTHFLLTGSPIHHSRSFYYSLSRLWLLVNRVGQPSADILLCEGAGWLSGADVLERMLPISRGSMLERGRLQAALPLGPQSPHWPPQLPVAGTGNWAAFYLSWHHVKPVWTLNRRFCTFCWSKLEFFSRPVWLLPVSPKLG